MGTNLQFLTDLLTITIEIFSRKFSFLCSAQYGTFRKYHKIPVLYIMIELRNNL